MRISFDSIPRTIGWKLFLPGCESCFVIKVWITLHVVFSVFSSTVDDVEELSSWVFGSRLRERRRETKISCLKSTFSLIGITPELTCVIVVIQSVFSYLPVYIVCSSYLNFLFVLRVNLNWYFNFVVKRPSFAGNLTWVIWIAIKIAISCVEYFGVELSNIHYFVKLKKYFRLRNFLLISIFLSVMRLRLESWDFLTTSTNNKKKQIETKNETASCNHRDFF